ncbi:MAG TPA: C40 family peptidase [Bacteroidales bacterium]|nr:C40 family peptidase [Bacteroidales bacterium]
MIRKRLFLTEGLFIALLVAVFQLAGLSCSRRLAPASFLNIESRAEERKLKEFLAGDTEEKLNTRNATPDAIIKTAERYLGVPHCMGGTTTKCMDCSGLLLTVFSQYGIRLPHSAEGQARYGRIINGIGQLRRGDLVFFIRSYQTSRFITHSGIYIGNNRFIHASTTKGVTITSLDDPWWNEKFIFGTRLF